MSRRLSAIRIACIVAGLLACGIAVLATNAGIEGFLVDGASARLSWGPYLFRALLLGHGLLVVALAIGWRSTAQAPAVRGGRGLWPESWALVVLVVISAAALALRLWQLDSCLWFDEVLTLVDFVRAPLGQIVSSFPSQNQHMLFSILAHVSVGLFGESAWSVRLPSVLFGIGSLWAIFLLGRSVIGTREALLTCALATFSYHHVWFSQNARGYMGLLFFATLTTWLWLEARSRTTEWVWYGAYAISLVLGMYTHLTMLFVPLTHLLLLGLETALTTRTPLARRAQNALPPVIAWVLAVTLTLQLYALALPEFLRTGLHEVSLESEWTTSIWVLQESIRSLQVGFGAAAVVFGAAGVAFLGCLDLGRRSWTALGAMITPPLLGGATMIALGHNLWPRFFFFAMGFALLIGVHGVMTTARMAFAILPVRQRAEIASAAGGVVMLLVIGLSAATLPRAYALPKQDFTGARDYVERERAPGDGVVAVGLAGIAYSRYFAPHWQFADTPAELESIRRTHHKVWLVYTLPVELRAYRPDVWGVVDRDFETVRVFPGSLGGGEVNVCVGRDNNRPEVSS